MATGRHACFYFSIPGCFYYSLSPANDKNTLFDSILLQISSKSIDNPSTESIQINQLLHFFYSSSSTYDMVPQHPAHIASDDEQNDDMLF
jgi:hypothetical protein